MSNYLLKYLGVRMGVIIFTVCTTNQSKKTINIITRFLTFKSVLLDFEK